MDHKRTRARGHEQTQTSQGKRRTGRQHIPQGGGVQAQGVNLGDDGVVGVVRGQGWGAGQNPQLQPTVHMQPV